VVERLLGVVHFPGLRVEKELCINVRDELIDDLSHTSAAFAPMGRIVSLIGTGDDSNLVVFSERQLR